MPYIKCPGCGKLNLDSVQECQKCGHIISVQAKPTQSSSLKTWVLSLNRIEQTTIAILLIVFLGTLGYGINSGIRHWTAKSEICSTSDGKKVYQLLEAISQRWDDSIELARNTPRMSLPNQISQLQAIRRDVQTQEWPQCAQIAQKHLISSMSSTIDGFIAFLDSDSDEEISKTHFALANVEYKAFGLELDKLNPQKQP